MTLLVRGESADVADSHTFTKAHPQNRATVGTSLQLAGEQSERHRIDRPRMLKNCQMQWCARTTDMPLDHFSGHADVLES